MQIRFFLVFVLGMAAHSMSAKATAAVTMEDGTIPLILCLLAGFMAATIAKSAR